MTQTQTLAPIVKRLRSRWFQLFKAFQPFQLFNRLALKNTSIGFETRVRFPNMLSDE
jgi:hypothetical protein